VLATLLARRMRTGPPKRLYTRLPPEAGYRHCPARRRPPTRRAVYPESFGFWVIPAARFDDWFLQAICRRRSCRAPHSRLTLCCGATGAVARPTPAARPPSVCICVHLCFPNQALSARYGATVGALASTQRGCWFCGLKGTADAHRYSDWWLGPITRTGRQNPTMAARGKTDQWSGPLVLYRRHRKNRHHFAF
jgi:hypothetical protein